MKKRIVTPLLAAVSLLLLWNDNTNFGVVYEVWHSTDLVNWSQVATVTDKQYAFEPTEQQDFFKVRARSLLTGLVSDWATK